LLDKGYVLAGFVLNAVALLECKGFKPRDLFVYVLNDNWFV
jgi:hypothetical protein